jgi:DNA-binding HxlR family transcriptional regulator
MKLSLEMLVNCPVTSAMQVIGGKWKILIIHLINNGINRFGKINMMLPSASRQMLTTQLRELERDGILERVIYPEIPPHVEYFLTPKGKALVPVFNALADWGKEFTMGDAVVATSET